MMAYGNPEVWVKIDIEEIDDDALMDEYERRFGQTWDQIIEDMISPDGTPNVTKKRLESLKAWADMMLEQRLYLDADDPDGKTL